MGMSYVHEATHIARQLDFIYHAVLGKYKMTSDGLYWVSFRLLLCSSAYTTCNTSLIVGPILNNIQILTIYTSMTSISRRYNIDATT